MIDNYEMFTRKAISSIETAIESASSMGHTYVDVYKRQRELRICSAKDFARY